jgi:hypothetical protein
MEYGRNYSSLPRAKIIVYNCNSPSRTLFGLAHRLRTLLQNGLR